MNLLIFWAVLMMVQLPHGILHVQYGPKDCKHVTDSSVFCKQVRVEFEGISSPVASTPEAAGEISGIVHAEHPDGPMYEYTYYPSKCKPIPNTKWHMCKDFRWKEIRRESVK